MLFIDSHCHLHDPRVINDIVSLDKHAKSSHVKYMVSCATKEDNFKLTAQLSEDFSSIIPCFGIHPWFVDTISSKWRENLEHYLQMYPSGVGETGLDFTDKACNQENQIKVFEHHFMLAQNLERPINIHIRKAWDTFIHILKKYGKLKVPGLIHSYSGSADMIPLFEKYGLYISFSGSVTKPGAKKVVKALEIVSKKRFVLETDSPDIYPCLPETETKSETDLKSNLTLKLNEPANLPAIAKIASARIGMGFQEFSNHAFNNSLTLFSPILSD